jgi:hypothetical protein
MSDSKGAESKEVKEFKSCAADIREWPNCSHRECHVLWYENQLLNHNRDDFCGATCDICSYRDCPYHCALHYCRIGCPECIVDRRGHYVGNESGSRRFINNYGDDDVPDLVESFERMPVVQMPGLQMPGLQMPGLQMPRLQMPGLQMPGLQMPRLQMPGLQIIQNRSEEQKEEQKEKVIAETKEEFKQQRKEAKI